MIESTWRTLQRTLAAASLAALAVPAVLAAQARILPDPRPARTMEDEFTGGRLTKSGVLSQFDSLGQWPMAEVGDSVTVYLFPDGDHLKRVVHARIVNRERFLPPVSWRQACDEIAHPGWLYALSPSSRALLAVVVPGVFSVPLVRPEPTSVRDGARQFFRAVADSAWQKWRDHINPQSDRALNYLNADFWEADGEARWNKVRIFGVHGPNGKMYAAFSFAMHDDYRDAPTTARTWVVDAWGFPVAGVNAQLDIYGVVDDGGKDAIVTSSGLIRWDGITWRFPAVYSEEPCLYHETMPVPAGYSP
ncbi:MAG: hypothetical protein ACREL5_08955 [Gemmatimonadales bacterium]